MLELVIEIIIGIGLSILVILMVFQFIIFNKYKKIKLSEDPDFEASNYQFSVGATYFFFPIQISEKDTNSKLNHLKNIYNKSIIIWWIILTTLLFITLTLILIKYLIS